MTKQQFIVGFKTAEFLSKECYNELGLYSSKFVLKATQTYQELILEVETINYEFALRKDGRVVKDENGNLEFDVTKNSKRAKKLSNWGATSIDVQFLNPIMMTNKNWEVMGISPDIFTAINGLSLLVVVTLPSKKPCF